MEINMAIRPMIATNKYEACLFEDNKRHSLLKVTKKKNNQTLIIKKQIVYGTNFCFVNENPNLGNIDKDQV